MKKFWFYRPFLGWNGISPFNIGSDEHNRKTYVLGYPFTGQLVIPSRKPYGVWFDKESNMLYVSLVTKDETFTVRTSDVMEHSMNVDYDSETGEQIGVEIFLPTKE